MAAFFDLLAHFFENIQTVVNIDKTHLPLTLNLLMILLDVGPFLQCPLDQSWHDAIGLQQRMRTTNRVAIRTGRHTISRTFRTEASHPNFLMMNTTDPSSMRFVNLPLQTFNLVLYRCRLDQAHSIFRYNEMQLYKSKSK